MRILILFLALLPMISHCNENGILELDVISYEDFVLDNPEALTTLNRALYEKGVVGIKGIPGYANKVKNYIECAQKLITLPEEVKNQYAPNHEKGETFLGYEAGKERFKNSNGEWTIDDLKVSYYAFVPDCSQNKWPSEVAFQAPFQEIGTLMRDIGSAVMEKIGLIGAPTGICLEGTPAMGRMLYYKNNRESMNPLWCGTHLDHSLFTALLPAFYFKEGQQIPEPEEAGLYVKTKAYETFKKVMANDPDLLMFQVGEFGQLVTNDAIRATEHCVQKALDGVERITMALFFDAPMDTIVYSTSVLTQDERYGGPALTPCSYREWHERTFYRYLVKENKK